MKSSTHASDQRGVALVEIALVVLVIAVLAIVGYKVYQARSDNPVSQTEQKAPAEGPKDTPSNQSQPETSQPPNETATEDLFSVTIPASWTKVDKKDSCRDAGGRSYYYEGSDGNFFDVCIDPMGRGTNSDVTWRLSPTSSGFSIATESPLCKAGEGLCDAGNGKFNIFMSAQGANKLNGHDYYFFAGNTLKEAGVDQQVFRDVLASFKVN